MTSGKLDWTFVMLLVSVKVNPTTGNLFMIYIKCSLFKEVQTSSKQKQNWNINDVF